MSAQTLLVPVDVLKTCVTDINNFHDECLETFDIILNSLRCLNGGGQWVGQSANAIINTTEANKKKFESILIELADWAAFIEKFLKEIEAADSEGAKKIMEAIK